MTDDIIQTNVKNESYQPIANKKKFFQDILWLLETHRAEIKSELQLINNQLGSQIEFAQAKSYLKGIEDFELNQINNIQSIKNSVIYASTNVPLLTIVSQIFLVASFSNNVWVRTPSATRDIYIKIFKLFSDYLPKHYTQHIHLITDPSDLAYDQFNRIYVMGQNRSGVKSIREPAELVILTGSPETAKLLIDRNIRNLKKTASIYPKQKQIILGNLAGVNPAVVVPSAKKNIDEIVTNLTYPFLVNGGQDCLNSDVIFSHTKIAPLLIKKLIARFSKLKMTSTTDTENGISPLTMSKSLDKLIEFKQKYLKYLINVDSAIINIDTKQVSPHLFVIPYKDFKTLDIQEHFAPFMIIIKYDNDFQLQEASLDTRLQRKAMFALIYGQNQMSEDVLSAKEIFQKAQHSVLLNTHLYNDFLMNIPFGGMGSDTSISVLIETTNDQMNIQTRNHPLLISKEVEKVFGKPRLKSAIKSSVTSNLDHWPEPDLMTKRSENTSLQTLRDQAHTNGLYIAVSKPFAPTADTNINTEIQNKIAKLYGLPIIFETDNLQQTDGVVLHVTDINHIVDSNSKVQGQRNLLLGDNTLYQKISQNKINELAIIKKSNPDYIPRTLLYSELPLQKIKKQEIDNLRKELIDLLDHASIKNENLHAKIQSLSYSLTKSFLDETRLIFSNGAYVKNYGEYATGDLGNGITTFNSSPQQIAKEFSMWAVALIEKYKNKKFDDEIIQNDIQNVGFANYAKFVNTLLYKPQNLIVQEKVELAQTAMGSAMEFRIDFMYGQAVHARMRYGPEYYPREMKQALDAFNTMSKKFPTSFRQLSGGADIALTKEGQWILFEFNFGGASGTLSPEYYPFEANRIFSFLQKKPTWLLSELNRISKLSLTEQNNFIRSLPNEKPIWWRTSIEDISQIEWAKELRDILLKNWMRRGSRVNDIPLLKIKISNLLESLGSNGNTDFNKLIETSDHFIQNEIQQKKLQDNL